MISSKPQIQELNAHRLHTTIATLQNYLRKISRGEMSQNAKSMLMFRQIQNGGKVIEFQAPREILASTSTSYIVEIEQEALCKTTLSESNGKIKMFALCDTKDLAFETAVALTADNQFSFRNVLETTDQESVASFSQLFISFEDAKGVLNNASGTVETSSDSAHINILCVPYSQDIVINKIIEKTPTIATTHATWYTRYDHFEMSKQDTYYHALNDLCKNWKDLAVTAEKDRTKNPAFAESKPMITESFSFR